MIFLRNLFSETQYILFKIIMSNVNFKIFRDIFFLIDLHNFLKITNKLQNIKIIYII